MSRRTRLAALLAVVGPGLLAGLSDDDPPGITTYSILGASHGYELLWVLSASTLALILFHELGARMGIAVSTVETYRKQIMDKLGLRSVAELTKYALRHGITSLD